MRPLSRLLTAVGLLAVLAVPSGSAAANGHPPMTCAGTGRLLTCAVALPPSVHVRHATVRVLVPSGYDAATGRLPVIYLLHGIGDDETAWTDPAKGDLQQLAVACRAIFVMPDGGSRAVAGWYSDWADGSYQWETFHTDVLPKAIDATFRTSGPSRRAVAGISMGGFGALSYAARHPRMYRAAAAYAPFGDTLFGSPDSGTYFQRSGQNPAGSTGMPSSRVWGDQTIDRGVWAAHNPYDLASKLRGTQVYLSGHLGSRSPSLPDGSATPATFAWPSYVAGLTDRLALRLRADRVPFVDGRSIRSYHNWRSWRAEFTASLRVVMPAVGAASPGCGR